MVMMTMPLMMMVLMMVMMLTMMMTMMLTMMLAMMPMPRWANIFLFFSVLFTLFLASNVIVLKVGIIVKLPQMVLLMITTSHLFISSHSHSWLANDHSPTCHR